MNRRPVLLAAALAVAAVQLVDPRPALAAARSDVADLPLIEQPGTPAPGAPLALVLSGDGGWAALDRGVAAALSAHGVPVVGLSTLRYFWRVKTPEQAAIDTERILRHYLATWRREQVLLVGYSFGADVLPFIVARLPAELRARVRLVALIAPSRSASFEVRIADSLRDPDPKALPTLPQIAQLRDLQLLCLYGVGDADAPCPQWQAAGVEAERIGDGHHLGGDYDAIAAAILAHAARNRAP